MTVKKGSGFFEQVKGVNLAKSTELEMVKEASKQTESEEGPVNKVSLLTHCEGFHLQAFNSKGQELKIILNPKLKFFEVLGNKQVKNTSDKNRATIESNKFKITGGTLFSQGTQQNVLTPLNEGQRKDIKEIIIYKPPSNAITYEAFSEYGDEQLGSQDVKDEESTGPEAT